MTLHAYAIINLYRGSVNYFIVFAECFLLQIFTYDTNKCILRIEYPV